MNNTAPGTRLWGGLQPCSACQGSSPRHSIFVFFSSSWKSRAGEGSHGLPCDAGLARSRGGRDQSQLCVPVCRAGSKDRPKRSLIQTKSSSFTMLWDPGTSPWCEALESCPHSLHHSSSGFSTLGGKTKFEQVLYITQSTKSTDTL